MVERKTEGNKSVKSILADVSNVQQTNTNTYTIDKSITIGDKNMEN